MQYEIMSDSELNSLEPGSVALFDIECYENFFFVAFKFMHCDRYVTFEQSQFSSINLDRLMWVMRRFTLVGFNSGFYDLPMLEYYLRITTQTPTCSELKAASAFIIERGVYDFRDAYRLPRRQWNHIDVMPICKGTGSLKLYAARLHFELLQDLPIHHDAVLTPDEMQIIRVYCCRGDLRALQCVVEDRTPEIRLRYDMSNQYGIDLLSKSDAQIAEAVFKSELSRRGIAVRRNDLPDGTTVRYTTPQYVRYNSPQLLDVVRQIEGASFSLDKAGKPKWPVGLGEKRKGEKTWALYAKIGELEYKIGMGGLHSMEKRRTVIADENHIIADHDVTSYYPSIILNQSLFPQHLTSEFLGVYRGIVDRRIEAKRNGDKVVSDSLKITINGSFGKYGNKYSVLYSPKLMLQTTISGQLSLLMLVEMLEGVGIHVISGNTDGIVCHYRREREQDVKQVITTWESLTGFVTEETRYKMLLSRDVNAYAAFKLDGKIKQKGSMLSAMNDIEHNPAAAICVDAALQFVATGASVADTVRNCTDIRKFIMLKKATGGCEKDGQYLGKVVRWYYSTSSPGGIVYCKPNKKGNKPLVGLSTNGRPCMDLPQTIPHDLDYDHYINEAWSVLVDCGYFGG